MIEIIKKKTEVDTPLCRVKSGVDGLFVFPSVPSGEYTLVMKYCTLCILHVFVMNFASFSILDKAQGLHVYAE